jgi:hypothetical protein
MGGAETRKGRAAAVSAALVSILILALVPAVGCGAAEKPVSLEQGGDNAEAVNTEEETIIDEEPGEETSERSEETAEDESGEPEDGTGTEFLLEGQEIGSGEPLPDLEIDDIHWSDHGYYFRIVFELRRTGGGETAGVPNACTRYVGEDSLHRIVLTLEDVPTCRFDYEPFAAEDEPVSLGDPVVENLIRLGTADTEPVSFMVECTYSPAHPGISSRPHRLLYSTSPLRVILDILKY